MSRTPFTRVPRRPFVAAIPVRALLCLVTLAAVFAPSAISSPAPAAAASAPDFPPYAYTVVSGDSTYDVMGSTGGAEHRLARITVPGVGLSLVTAHISPDGGHLAIRVTGDSAGGSALRLIAIASGQEVTVTLSHSKAIGIGAFAWAPDSRRLAYTVASPEAADADTGSGVLWVVGANARGAYRLTVPPSVRLIGWSPDSKGLYYARDDAQAGTSDLWYVPLDTETPLPVRRSSLGAVQYSGFAVSPVPVPGAAPGAARVATLAVGDLSLLPPPNPPAPDVPHSRLAPRPATATAPGVVAGNGAGAYAPLRNPGEDFQVMAWDGTGTHLLLSGGKSRAVYFADANTGQRWRLSTDLNNLAPVTWSRDGRYGLLTDASGPTTHLVTFDTTNGAIVRWRTVGQAGKPARVATDLAVPYISQIWHLGNAFDGNWACGPTSIAMVLAYYGRLAPWPFPAKQVRVSAWDRIQANALGAESGTPNLLDGHLYGRYVTDAFSYDGHAFTAPGKDPRGNTAEGLYGTIVGDTTLAQWDKIKQVLALYGLRTDYVAATWEGITAQLDAGNPVILSTTLTEGGHILVARGYTANGYLLVNDPYGNHFGPEGYGLPDGGDVAYAWSDIPIKLAMTVRGKVATVPPSAPTPVPAKGK